MGVEGLKVGRRAAFEERIGSGQRMKEEKSKGVRDLALLTYLILLQYTHRDFIHISDFSEIQNNIAVFFTVPELKIA